MKNKTPQPTAPQAEAPMDLRPEALLDSQDIMFLFHISSRTLRNWRRRGILPYCKIGNKIYFQRIDVEDLLRRTRRVKV